MTVHYSFESANSSMCTFLRLLFRWRGSIYKLLWKETLIFLTLYGLISLLYRVGLNHHQREVFKKISIFVKEYTDYIPLTFLLGFYVSMIVGRWWSIYMSIPWPDNFLIQLTACLPGDDEESRIIRRTIARLINATSLLVLRDISSPVKKRFPSLEHLVVAGFLTDDELKRYNELNCPYHRCWVPFQWCFMLIQDCVKSGKIASERYALKLQKAMLEYKSGIGTVFCYDSINVPLSYTQVVTLAVHTFFMAALLGRQFLYTNLKSIKNAKTADKVDIYFPVFTFLQFLFYMGWLKVAESLINPLGEDDDDFEMNWLIDRNFQVSYLIVDKNYVGRPELIRDVHWDEELAEIPYTLASRGLKTEPIVGSAEDIEVAEEDQHPFLVSEEDANQSKANTPRTGSRSLFSRESFSKISRPSMHKKSVTNNFFANAPTEGELKYNANDIEPKFSITLDKISEDMEGLDAHQLDYGNPGQQLQIAIEDSKIVNTSEGEECTLKFGKLIRERNMRRQNSQAGENSPHHMYSNHALCYSNPSLSSSIQSHSSASIQLKQLSPKED